MSSSVEDMSMIETLHCDSIDMSEEAIPSEIIEICASTLNDHMTPEEQALGYFTKKNLKTLYTWQE